MTYEEFVNKYNGKGIDFDGYYGFQCMDLAHQYAVEVVGKDFAPAPAAKDVWAQNPEGYDKISNTPDNAPQKGDIIIWGVGVGPFGHIAICDDATELSFISFDQNWPINSLCHLQNHNYNGVLGWFHPQSSAILPQNSTQSFTDQTKIPLKQYGDMEIQAIVGKLGDLDKANQKINDLNSVNNQQVEIITDLRNQLTECQNRPSGVSKTYTTPIGQFFGKLADSFG
jgi:hypothetical protein